MIFSAIAKLLEIRIKELETKFSLLSEEVISIPKNAQNRSIKQIVGHMVDSASNNTHRVIHLQYQKSPVEFPNYASYGNNEKWIAIQNYQAENWKYLLQFWKYSHLHFIHIIQNIDSNKLNAKWLADENQLVSLKEMIEDFPRHFELHVKEIKELINC